MENYSEIFPIDNHVQNLIIEDLYPDSQYHIMITACPTDCIAELSDNANATTGIGLPGKIVTATVSQNYETNYCEVSWTWPESISKEDVGMFQVNYQATFVHKPPSSDITTIHGEGSVNPPKLTYNLKTEPNRIYNFDVSAVSCAGSGPKTSVTGECITGSEAPEYVKEPNLLDETPGSTKDMEIILPNEINGPISCVFVVVKNGPIDTNEIFDIVKLREVSTAALKDETPNGEEYLAVAIRRSEFSEESVTVKLGDETVSDCDVTETDKKNNINYYGAKNWPLQMGNFYSTYVVTTSPNGEEMVLFQQSFVIEFENGNSNPGTDKTWIAGVVVGIIALATLVVGAIFYMKRRHQSENRESSTRSKSTSRDHNDLYETTGYQTAEHHNISSVKDKDTDATKIYDGYLFERFDTEKFSSDAEKQCTVRGAWLFEPNTDDLFNELIDNFIPSSGFYFMGLKKVGGEWIWSDYSKPTNTHWSNSNEPNENGQDCACVFNKKWVSVICSTTPRRYVCQSPEIKLHYNGYLFGKFDTELPSSDAEKQCTTRGAWLFEPKTDELFNELTDNFISTTGCYLMGLRYLANNWRWSDWSVYTKWTNINHWENGIVPSGSTEKCACVQNKKWVSVSCSTATRYVCQSLQPPSSTIIISGNLLERFAEVVENYTTASDRCEMRGAQLVEIKDGTMDDKISQWIRSDTSSYLMGIQYSTSNSAWEYSSDKTEIIYMNWKADEGDDPDEKCACILSDGWIGDVCSGGTFKYICQSYPKEATTYDGDLLEKFDNAMANAAARSRCSLWNGNLVDMKTQTYNNKVQQLIGTSDEYHIGLKYFDGEYRWTDGSATTYFDWGSGEGGKNNGQDCVKSDRNYWVDISCGASEGFICQTSEWCTGNSCQNGGICVSDRCECTAGYFGDNCASDKYCPNNVNPCQNGGSCENSPGEAPYYGCNCMPGYFDDICYSDQYCPNSPNPCKNGGSCENTPGQDPYFRCDCMPGFFGDICSSDQYCPHNPDTCKNGGSCVNTPAQDTYFRCDCMPGYFGNTCSSNQYCPHNPDSCKNGGSCVNTPGLTPYFRCDCMPGYFGDTCSSDLYCTNNINPTCQNGGTCENTPGQDPYFRCDCVPGYFNDNCSSDRERFLTNLKSYIYTPI